MPICSVIWADSRSQWYFTKRPDNYNITLDHVSFSYEEGAEKALDDISLTIKQGTITALVGESGGGKSTIANLIARFWDVQSGSVKVGCIDVRDMNYNEWMNQVSIVFQDTNLFKMSIADNVAFYTPGASRANILRALHLAQCDDILEKLPDGADTVIGTKGVYLSGGEMQRISLARAILKDAPVVLLDEATASCIYTQKGNKKIRKPQAANQTALIFDRRAAARLLSINSIRRLCWS